MKKGFTLLFLFTMALSFGQTNLYEHPNFKRVAETHQTIAILPFKAIVKLRPKQMKDMSEEQLKKMEADEGLAVQNALHSWFLKRKKQGKTDKDVQEPSRTNALLKKNEIDMSTIDAYTLEELAALLGVDAVISGTLKTNKPMSEGASAALGLLVGFWGSTNSGTLEMSVNDGKTGDLMWKYEKKLGRSMGSDTDTVINALMRKASRRLTYMKK
ncbi:MAG: hypothetical protein AAF934_08260 [Bacteroidota bacterium]